MCYAPFAGEAPGAYVETRPVIDAPVKAATAFFKVLRDMPVDREVCLMLVLDTKHALITTEVVSLGSVDHTFMAPREVYRSALTHGAAAIVLCHTHPSGSTEPSSDDEAVTRRLAKAGETLGVNLLDHLVIGGQIWTSMARRGSLGNN